MKRQLFLLICWGTMLSSCIYSQTYFNNRYDIAANEFPDYATTIIFNNDSYILGGETWLYYEHDRITLSILNLDGELQAVKHFENPDVIYGAGYPGFITKSISDGFWLAGLKRSAYPGWIRDNGLLMRLDKNCDSLWTREYGDMVEPCDTEVIFRQIHTLKNGQLSVLGGVMDYTAQRPFFYLLHLDSLGNKLWENFYGQMPYYYFPYSMACTSDKGYILGGVGIFDNNALTDPILIKTDSVGNEEWFLNLGSEFRDDQSIVDTTADGYIIAGAPVADSAINNEYSYRRINYIKLDNSGNVIWNKKYGKSNLDTDIWSLKSLPDGRIISTGSRLTDYPACPDIVSWIFCINSSGDSLWYREYTLLDAEYSVNTLYDISPAADNGFIACGYVVPAWPDTGSQDTWVLKVDSIGCESLENCWAGVDEKPEMEPSEPCVINVFPNPSDDKVFFGFSPALKPEEMDLTVFNLMGVTVFHQPVHLSSGLFELDISSWPAGMYVARIVFMNEVAGTVKFVKE